MRQFIVKSCAHMTAPERTAAQHQSLLHFVGEGNWCDEKVLAKVREMVLLVIERHGPIEAWIIDDTGFPKKGRHSVGVARQYCGELGKQDNCQIAVTLSIANHHASLPIAYRLYLPKEWAKNRTRRRKASVPKEVTAAAAIRGGIQPVIKLGLQHWASPIAAAAIGYSISSVLLIAAALVRNGGWPHRFDRRGAAWFAAVGICNGMAVLATYAALGHGAVALVSPLIACYPLVTVLLGHVLLKHSPHGEVVCIIRELAGGWRVVGTA